MSSDDEQPTVENPAAPGDESDNDSDEDEYHEIRLQQHESAMYHKFVAKYPHMELRIPISNLLDECAIIAQEEEQEDVDQGAENEDEEAEGQEEDEGAEEGEQEGDGDAEHDDAGAESGTDADDPQVSYGGLMALNIAINPRLGPKGLFTKFRGVDGRRIITKDGAALLRGLKVDDRIVSDIINLSENQADNVGDGVKTVTILAIGLLIDADYMMRYRKVSKETLIRGYEMASKCAHDALKSVSININSKSKDEFKNALQKVAMTTLSIPFGKEQLASVLADAGIQFQGKQLETLPISKLPGESTLYSKLERVGELPPQQYEIQLQGTSSHLLDEAERSTIRALRVLSHVVREKKVIYGGGWPEVVMANAVKQLASDHAALGEVLLAFSQALLLIPQCILWNAFLSSGVDPIDIDQHTTSKVTQLEAAHGNGNVRSRMGLDTESRTVADMERAGIFESLFVKLMIVDLATKKVTKILGERR